MALPRLIGITGKAGAGKDTLGDALAKHFNGVTYSFALPIKQALNAMFGWDMDLWNDRVWKERVIPWLGKSPRVLAQTLGTEWGRDIIHPELWALLAMDKFADHASVSDTPFIIKDVRFDNETNLINLNGGVVINIERPDLVEIATANHTSEAGVSYKLLDCQVINNGSVSSMVDHAIDMLSRTRTYGRFKTL